MQVEKIDISDGVKTAAAAVAIITAGIALDKCRGKIADFFKKLLPKAGKKAGQQAAEQTGKKAAADIGQRTAAQTGEKAAAHTGQQTASAVPKKTAGTTVTLEKVIPSGNKPKVPSAPSAPVTRALPKQTLDAQITEFEKMSDSSLSKGAKDYLKQLKPHNFVGDESEILVTSKFNGSNSGYELVALSKKPFSYSIKSPDISSGQKITIQCLPDGRKAIYVKTPSGGKQPCGRGFENAIKIVSDGKEFTPVQKSLIEIMSTRGPVREVLAPDILAVANFNNGGKLGVYKDILLSAIHTAREQAADKIKPDLVKKALAVANPGDIFQF